MWRIFGHKHQLLPDIRSCTFEEMTNEIEYSCARTVTVATDLEKRGISSREFLNRIIFPPECTLHSPLTLREK